MFLWVLCSSKLIEEEEGVGVSIIASRSEAQVTTWVLPESYNCHWKWGIVLWDWALKLWDLMLSPGKQSQDWTELEDIWLASAAQLIDWFLVGRNLHTLGVRRRNILCWLLGETIEKNFDFLNILTILLPSPFYFCPFCRRHMAFNIWSTIIY